MPINSVFTVFKDILTESEITKLYGLSKAEIPNEIVDIHDYY